MSSATIQLLKGATGTLPEELWTCLPPLLQTACSYFQQPEYREAFLHGSLPVLSRVCENVIIPLQDDDHRIALQVFIYGHSGSGKGGAEKAPKLLEVIEATEEEAYQRAMAKWKAEGELEDGTKAPEPQRNDMSIGLRSTPNTWVREMKKNPKGVVHLVTDTEGDTLKGGGYKEHGSIRPMIKKGFHGEREQYTLKDEGTVSMNVWLSAMISCTPEQMKAAMNEDTEDGFAARFIYHKTPKSDGIFDDPFTAQNEESIGRKLHHLGKEVQNIHDELRRRGANELEVRFSRQQQAEHIQAMQIAMTEAVKEHPHLNGFVVRLSHSVLRTAALFTVLRDVPSSQTSGMICDEVSWSAACMLRDQWIENMYDAFVLLNPNTVKEDGRMNMPSDVRELVCRWRIEDNCMPQAAVARLEVMPDLHIQHWLKSVDSPSAAVGKVQRAKLKELNGKKFRRTGN